MGQFCRVNHIFTVLQTGCPRMKLAKPKHTIYCLSGKNLLIYSIVPAIQIHSRSACQGVIII